MDANERSEAATRDAWLDPSVADRFARMAEATPAGLVLSRANGQIELVNRHCELMFGYARDELRDMPLEVLMPARFQHGHVALRDRFFAEKSSRPMGGEQELYGLRKDGTEFPLEIGLTPIEMDGVAMVVATLLDISARRQKETRQEQERVELARSNAALEEFAYVASHDLKAPLRAISHLVEWISEDIEATAGIETVDNLRLLRARVVRLQLLLDGLLAYARIGHSRSSFEDVDIAGVVADVVSVLAPPATFTITCQEGMPALHTHRASILMVLQNLIGNAIKHHDRADGHVGIAMRIDKGVAEFRVSDDGPGISARFHERIFVIFQTLASRDDVESSGIGLAIVKKRVEGHGGRIWVESEPPARGATFVFTWKEPAP